MRQRSVWSSLCIALAASASACGPVQAPSRDAGVDGSDPGNREQLDLTLIAGDIGGPGNADGTGAGARFSGPAGVGVDRTTGTVYLADSRNSTIRKITAAGVVTTFAGAAGVYGARDGVGDAARFDAPSGLAVDTAGNVYVADRNNSTIRKISSAGTVTTLAGSAGASGSADGMGAAARFDGPLGIAVDSAGAVYVADSANATIRKIVDGTVTTLAGSAKAFGSADGMGAAARFNAPTSVTVDAGGNVYVADQGNHTIRKIMPSGAVSTLAGSAGLPGSANGVGSAARFNSPTGVIVDRDGAVYVADQGNQTIRKVTFSGDVTTVTGTAGSAGSADGAGPEARFNAPTSVAIDTVGTVYVADRDNHLLRRVSSTALVTTLAGRASVGAVDGNGETARFSTPTGVVVDAAGTAYVVDSNNHTIRKITSAGTVTTLVGVAGTPGTSDGIGAAAHFNTPTGVALGPAGELYVTDTENGTIRKITPGGVVSTFAGTAGRIGSVDGTGPAARFNGPSGIVVDTAGNVYVADQTNHVIRKISPAGVVTTMAGTATKAGSADGVGAEARFNFPSGLSIDGAGNLYVTDEINQTIRKVTAAGAVTTLAGLAGMSGTTDGVGNAARFRSPVAASVDRDGNIYVADSLSSTIRKITPAGATTTFAGTAGAAGLLLGDAPRLALPRSIAAVGDELIVCDSNAIVRLRRRVVQ